jgi:hypothetical protein
VPRAKGVTTPTKPSPKGSPTDGARAGQWKSQEELLL